MGDMKKPDMKAIVAERMPEPLDNAVKCAKYMDLRKLFNQQLTPEKLFALLPTALPITNRVAVGGVPLVGIAQYPLEKWRSNGEAYIKQVAWLQMALLIGEHGD